MIEPIGRGVGRIALRTPTLPPATHTNTWVLGDDALTVVDPASPWPDEQARLLAALARTGIPVERILLTHHHDDHVGGAQVLVDALEARGHRPRVAAHAETARRVSVPVDEILGDTVDCGSRTFEVGFTPGHAPGHVVLHDRLSGRMIAGDMVAGLGTILIDPVDGSLARYLDSLQRMRSAGPTALLPAHGPILANADALLAMYLAHRQQRNDQVLAALDRHGAQTPAELADRVYPELPAPGRRIAAIQVTSILIYLQELGWVRALEDGAWTR